MIVSLEGRYFQPKILKKKNARLRVLMLANNRRFGTGAWRLWNGGGWDMGGNPASLSNLVLRCFFWVIEVVRVVFLAYESSF